MGTGAFFVAGCLTSIYIRLTPLYTTIACTHASTQLENLHVGVPLIAPTTFDLIIQMNCTNPNPYSIGFDWVELGAVYLGKGMTKVGDTWSAPGKQSYFPADGFGSVWVRANTTINAMLLGRLAGEVLTSGGQLALRLQLRQSLHVDVNLIWGIGQSVSQLFKKDCGMMLSDLFHPKVGPMACADSFDQLSIPPVGADPFDGTMRFSAKQLAPKKIEEGMALKNWGLGVSMAVCYISGLVLYALAASRFWLASKAEKRRQAKHQQVGSESESGESC